MIVYFANRAMKILGLASTELPEGFHITDDTEVADVETGILTLECTIHWTRESRSLAQECTAVGNYMLKQTTDFVKDYRVDWDAECYTIIEVEEDTKDRTTYIYAESGGMDLLNSVVGPYEATRAHTAAWYISMFTENSGFIVNHSYIDDLERKLEWTGEATVAERVASVGTQFDHAEIEYRVALRGLQLWEKLINIHKQRGEDNHVILRLNQEVDRIVTTTSIADLATALYVEGGIPEGEEDPVTLEGYSATADGGDIYTDGDGIVKSKSALEKWTRYANAQEPYQSGDGHIVKRWSYDTTSQSELFNRAVTQLQKIYTPAVNYEVYITIIPDEIGIGDYIYIVDEEGELFIQSRVLGIETSAANNTAMLTLGDYRLVSDGLSTQVDSLTSQVASVRSQTVQTAATVDKLQSDVSSLKSSSVSVTLSNSYGSATGTLSFSSGMSLNIQYLFNGYVTTSTQGTITIRDNSTGASSWVSNSLANGWDIDIQNLLSYYVSKSNDNATITIRDAATGAYSYVGNTWANGWDIDISSLLSNYLKQGALDGYVQQSAQATITIKTSSASANGSFSFQSGCEIDISDLVGGGTEFGDITATTIKITGSTSTSSGNFGLTVSLGASVGFLSADGNIITENGNVEAPKGDVYARGVMLTSDALLKTSIQAISDARVDNITPVTFKWRDGDNTAHYGYIAQEVREHIPEIVKENDDGLLSLAYTEIIPLLHAKINTLEERIARLEELIYGEKER